MTKDAVIDVIHKTIYGFFDIAEDDSEEPINEKDKLLLEVNKAVCNAIKDMPDEEHKTGKWINAYPEIEPNPMFGFCICSVCGFEQSLSIELNYCPNCGTKMEGATQMPNSCKCILDKMVYKKAMTEKERDKILRNLKGIEWHQYPNEVPTENGFYLATLENVIGNRIVRVLEFKDKIFFTASRWSNVISWADLPKPYEEE